MKRGCGGCGNEYVLVKSIRCKGKLNSQELVIEMKGEGNFNLHIIDSGSPWDSLLHNVFSGVHGISSAFPSILFLLTCESLERVYREGIEQNGHSNQKADYFFPREGSSPAAPKLFGKIMDSLDDSITS